MWVFFSGTQGQVTLKWIVRSCPNSNSSKILCMFMLSASSESATFIKIQSKQNKTRLCSEQGQKWVFCGTKGQVTPKVWSGQNSNLLRDFMPVQIICKSQKDLIKTKQAMLWARSNMVIFGTQGLVTPKWRVQSGQDLNSSVILCLSRLSASLINIWLKLKKLCTGQGQIWRFSALKGK